MMLVITFTQNQFSKKSSIAPAHAIRRVAAAAALSPTQRQRRRRCQMPNSLLSDYGSKL
jgi:hypothetical protein